MTTARTLSIIGTNGDQLDLDGSPFDVADSTVVLGSTQTAVSYRSTVGGRRTDRRTVVECRASFEILIDTVDTVAARDAMRRLSAALAGDVWLVVDHGDGDPTALVGSNEPTPAAYLDNPDTDIWSVPVEIVAVDVPYWVSVNPESTTLTIGIDDSEPWLGWTPSDSGDVGSDDPINSDGYFIADADSTFLDLDLDPDGGADVWPEWSITGPLTSVEAVHLRTGQVWQFDAAVAAGEILTIDTDRDRRTVEVDGVNRYFDLAQRSDLWQLRPGENPVQLSVAGGTNGQTIVGVTWHVRRRSP